MLHFSQRNRGIVACPRGASVQFTVEPSIASIASNLFFLMTAYSLPHPTANSQSYTVKLIQKDLFASNPHVLRALKITLVATHDGKAEFASLSRAWLTPLLLVPAA